jgi:hypothetical protein
MSQADVTRFPHFAGYVRTRMPEVINVPVIVRNMQRFGSLTREQLRHALLWGTDPLIVITDLLHGQCGVPQANGCFEPANPNQIEIDLGRVQDFETDANGAGTDHNARGQNVFIVGTTILHEMCHWGRFLNGQPAEIAGATPPLNEAGIAFEVATYGRNIGGGPQPAGVH